MKLACWFGFCLSDRHCRAETELNDCAWLQWPWLLPPAAATTAAAAAAAAAVAAELTVVGTGELHRDTWAADTLTPAATIIFLNGFSYIYSCQQAGGRATGRTCSRALCFAAAPLGSAQCVLALYAGVYTNERWRTEASKGRLGPGRPAPRGIHVDCHKNVLIPWATIQIEKLVSF